MKKAILGVIAVGAAIALRPALKRRMFQKMREHCEQMMREFASSSEASGRQPMSADAMRRRCEEMATRHEERTEPVATA